MKNRPLAMVISPSAAKSHNAHPELADFMNKEAIQEMASDCLAADLAHEIRNPLTTVKGFIQLIKPDLAKMGKQQHAELLIEEIDRANELISEFLGLFKPALTAKQPIALQLIVAEIMTLFESEARLRRISLKADFSDRNTLHVTVNDNQLKQVLINLIRNAFEAIEEKGGQKDGSVILYVGLENEQVLLSVEDNGCGFERNMERQLFTPFYSTKEKGTGIGLSICKKIIKEHQGIIQIESEPGKGSRFTILLPHAEVE